MEKKKHEELRRLRHKLLTPRKQKALPPQMEQGVGRATGNGVTLFNREQ